MCDLCFTTRLVVDKLVEMVTERTLFCQVGSVLFAPGHVLSLLTLGTACGMVMDVGYKETLVVPVSFASRFMAGVGGGGGRGGHLSRTLVHVRSVWINV